MKIVSIILLIVFSFICIHKIKEKKEILEQKEWVTKEEQRLRKEVDFWYNEYLKCSAEYEKNGDNQSYSLMEQTKREYELAQKRLLDFL